MRDPQETSLELRVRASCCSMLGTAGAAPMLAWRARGHSRISCVLPSFHILCSTVNLRKLLCTGLSAVLHEWHMHHAQVHLFCSFLQHQAFEPLRTLHGSTPLCGACSTTL